MSLLTRTLSKIDYWATELVEPEYSDTRKKILVVGSNVPTLGRSLDDLRGNLITINLEESRRIAIISKTRAGKSSLMASMAFFGKMAGFQPFILFDFKNEYRDMLKNLSMFYLGEDIFSDMMVMKPYYLKEHSDNGQVYQFDIDDLTETERALLFSIYKPSDYRKRDVLENIIGKLPKSSRNIAKVIEVLNDRLKVEALVGRGRNPSIDSLASNIAMAVRQNIVGEGHRINIESLLTQGHVLDMVFPKFDTVDEMITQSYVAILEKMLKNSLERRRRPVLTIVDEGRLIIPRSKSEGETSRKEIIKNIKTTGYLGETMAFGVQDLKDVEESIVGQSSYYFISHKIQSRDIERMLEATSLPDEVKGMIANEKIVELHKRAHETPECRPFFMVNEEGKSEFVYPFLAK